MRLEIEKKQPVDNPSESQVRTGILKLRSYGPSSFASLTDETGNYLQIAGGGITCMLERRDALTGRQYRAFQETENKNYPDGTLLVFGGGEIALFANEWFMNTVAAEAFVAFLLKKPLPDSIRWRVLTGT